MRHPLPCCWLQPPRKGTQVQNWAPQPPSIAFFWKEAWLSSQHGWEAWEKGGKHVDVLSTKANSTASLYGIPSVVLVMIDIKNEH